MAPIFTLVIPAYRVAPYLPACLQSVADQDGDDFEAFVVDDGSPDECPAIADAFAARDARFTVVHQANAGVSVARNAGLARAKGEWIWFVDGDDLIAPGALAALRAVLTPELDMALFRHETLPPSGKATYAHTATRLTEAALHELRLQCVYARADSPLAHADVQSASFALYRASFLRGNALGFRPGLRKGQDALFSLEALLCCRSALLLDAPLYRYRRNAGSVSVRYNPAIGALTFEILSAYAELLARCAPGDAAVLERLDCRRMQMTRPALFLYYCNAQNPHSYRERRAECLAFLREPELARAFARIGSLGASPADRAVYELIRRRAFAPLDLMYRLATGRAAKEARR